MDDADNADARPVSPRSRQRVRVGSGELHVMESGAAADYKKNDDHQLRSQRRRHNKTIAVARWSDWLGALQDMRRAPTSRATLLRLLLLLLVVLFVFDFTVKSLVVAYYGGGTTTESNAPSGWFTRFVGCGGARSEAAQPQNEPESCSPEVVDISSIPASRSRHRFYDLLKRRGVPTPPVFEREFQVLCESDVRHQSRFGYCLPIGGRKDEPFCARPDRMDLLVPSVNATGFCYASVLHMLFVEVYEDLQAIGAAPVVAYGTLLGGVRNGSLISYTEDADIGYLQLTPEQIFELKQRLWAKGLHMFYFTRLWRVCVAPTHPLASVLYSPEQGLARNYKVPYLDMYDMVAVPDPLGGPSTYWELFGTRNDRLLAAEKVAPFSSVTINGMAFDTFADPADFLVNEYGADYLTPVQRPQRKTNGFNFFDAFLEDDKDETVHKTEKKTDKKEAK